MSKKDIKLAIILEAAGDAKRFGRNKLLEPMSNGHPMVCHILDIVRDIDVYKKIIVTQYETVASMADGFEVVLNQHPELGISLSMQLGIEAAGDADAYMFCVCDQPHLKASTISKLIETYAEASQESDSVIASLSCRGHMYNPKIFSSIYKDELMSLSGDIGGRQIIKKHLDDLILVEATSEDEVIDIDVPF